MSFLSYDINGKGTPIVLLHGYLENRNMWSKTIVQLSNIGKCISIDLPGHGNSSSMRPMQSLTDIADELHTLFLELNLKNIHLVGHSLGGYVSMAYAKKYPEMLSTILMCHSSAASDSEKKKVQRDRANKAVAKFKRTYLHNSIPLLFIPERQKELQQDINLMIDEASKMSTEVIQQYLLMMKTRDNNIELGKRTTIPISYIIGKHDPLLESSVLLEEVKTSNASYFLMDNAGHMGHLEDEKEFTKLISQFILSQKNGPLK